ncbi:MAG: hypothetical protein IK997_03765 [Bacilli bacterium]|nr:hypothetical protein [Bacilli bacterium]
MNELELLQKQHYENYVNAIKEIVINNTNSLVDSDINSLLSKPPLDSMDQIKTKILGLAKKEKIVLDTELLNKILDNYRKNVLKTMNEIKKMRSDYILKIVDSSLSYSSSNIIKVTKKDMIQLQKLEKKYIKQQVDDCVNRYLLKKMEKLFSISEDFFQRNEKEINKFFSIKGIYQKQLLESIDFKILVKDTILINGIKEQGERYLFTINNSRLFN